MQSGFCKTLSKVVKTNRKDKLFPGKLVSGYITFKCNEFALVDIGLTQSATLLNNASWMYKNFKVGDLIKVYAENVNDRNEGPIVSRRELDLNETWDLADKLCQSKEEVLAKIVNMNRNGIGMEVFDMFGAIFWTKELIEVENELRKRTFLMTYVRATCRRHNMIVLSPSQPIIDSDKRYPSSIVWTGVIDLCDKGIWTLVDGCNGIIMLNGKPWCKALNLINRMPFGEVILSDFVKLEQTRKLKRSEDLIELIVNFIMEVAIATKWDESITTIDTICVWKWITSLDPADRERWIEWRERNYQNFKLKFIHGRFNKLSKFKFSEGYWNEINEEGEKQNRIWRAEHSDLALLLCGFEWERFKITRNVIELILPNRISSYERTWLTKMERAWLNESKSKTTLKWNGWTFPSWERRMIINRLRLKRNISGSWNPELKWGTEQKIKTINRLKDFRVKLTEGKNLKDDQTEGTESLRPEELNIDEEIFNIESEEVNEIDRTLNNEWEEEWYSERGRQIWERRYAETEASVVEIRYGNLNGIKTLRPAYGVIIGMDIQAKMLITAINKRLLTYVWDLSINSEEVTLLQLHWKDDCALRLAPIALSYELDDVLVEINVDGYKHLKFIDERMGHPTMGKVVSLNGNETTIEFENGVYGKLRFNATEDTFGIEIGMEVDVTITDFNPTTNDINLELSEEEEVRTILIER
ncbi:MAG: hypothetical protein ACTS41_00560 [Candidatus Hodgkinia cicadicola]